MSNEKAVEFCDPPGTPLTGFASQKINLLGKSEKELQDFFTGIGEPPYRGKQIFGWIYKKQIDGFDPITDFTKTLRSRLSEVAEIKYPEIVDIKESRFDGTLKFLLKLSDGNKIETVLIPSEWTASEEEKFPDDSRARPAPLGDPRHGTFRETVCVSTQVGCPLDCKFCATGTMKFARNLTAGEIISQVIIAQRHAKKKITNVVFMGMGEPLLNHEAVINTIRILTDDRSINIRAKGITVSTAGIPDKILLLAREKIKFRLAVSLHSLDEDVRTMLMPINKKYKLDHLLASAKEFAHARHDRITFEYVLFDKLNDKKTDISKLIKLSQDIPLKINLLRYHPLGHLSEIGLQVDPAALKLKPSDRIEEFANELRESGITVFVRSNSGEDINGACGQLAAKNISSHKVAKAITTA